VKRRGWESCKRQCREDLSGKKKIGGRRTRTEVLSLFKFTSVRGKAGGDGKAFKRGGDTRNKGRSNLKRIIKKRLWTHSAETEKKKNAMMKPIRDTLGRGRGWGFKDK